MSLTLQEQKDGWRIHYGIAFPPVAFERPMPLFQVEMMCYMDKNGESSSKKYLGRFEHFKRGITELFAHPNCSVPFQWNPNAVRMGHAWVEKGDIGFVGHGGSTKSYCLAAFGVWEFLCDPSNVGVLITSTTLKESQLRIWGHVSRLWNDAWSHPEIRSERYMPGKLLRSDGIIRAQQIDSHGNLRTDNQRGLMLIAGALAESKVSVDKMKGFHPPRLFVILDELSDISVSIPEAVESNLKKTEFCKVCASLNARELLDAGGIYCEPLNGWDHTDTKNLAEWEGKAGRTILRFDGKFSANKLMGEAVERGEMTAEEYEQKSWKGLMTLADWRRDASAMGENSPRFLQQNRAIWPTEGSVEVLYTADLILKSFCKKPVPGFIGDAICIAALDPAFSNGGDKCPIVKCMYGKAWIKRPFLPQSTEPVLVHVIQFHDLLDLNDKIDPNKDRNEEIVKHAIEYLKDVNTGYVAVKDFSMDITGAGASLATLFARDFGEGFHKVDFHGLPTDRPISATDKMPMQKDGKTEGEPRLLNGKDLYEDRVSELWGIGEQFMRSGQIKNLPPVIFNQLNKRPKDKSKKKIKMMSKKKMRSKSPDEADAFFICLDLLRERYNFLPAEKAKDPEIPKDPLIVLDDRGNTLMDLTSLHPDKKVTFSQIRKKFAFYN